MSELTAAHVVVADRELIRDARKRTIEPLKHGVAQHG
jgi:hypothetical protein